jgi:hypothetical protein
MMAVKTIGNLKINGVRFDDMTGRLRIDEGKQEVYDMGGREPIYMAPIPTHHELELFPDTSKDISLIMYGLITAVKAYNPEGAVPELFLTISGTDVEKPWVTYEGEWLLTECTYADSRYGTSGHTQVCKRNKVEHAGFISRGAVQAVIDENMKPKVHAYLSELETSEAIASLIRTKSTTTDPKRLQRLDGAITHLQKAIKGVNDRA